MPTKKLGYARVAVHPSDIELQINRLNSFGCTELFLDKGVSGDGLERPGLKSLLAAIEPGDTVVVCTLSKIARSAKSVFDLSLELESRGALLRVLDESILEGGGPSAAGGRLLN
ncbi:MAG: recombinase family protein [Steroidobacteraceae bacterium]